MEGWDEHIDSLQYFSGSMEWQEGPSLPVQMMGACALGMTTTNFLVVYGRDIHEFDTSIAGPTSSEGWREAGRYEMWLKLYRTHDIVYHI